MPTHYNSPIGCGANWTPSVRGCITDYLMRLNSFGQSAWGDGTVINPIHSDVGGDIVLAPEDTATRVDGIDGSCMPFTGKQVTEHGLLGTFWLDGLCIGGSGQVQETTNTPGVPNAQMGMRQAGHSYAWQGTGGPAACPYPWEAITRGTPSNWWESYAQRQWDWIELPAYVRVGGYNATLPFFFLAEPNVAALASYQSLPFLYILAAALPQGHRGAPLVWAPLAWRQEEWNSLGPLPDPEQVHCKLLADLPGMADAWELGCRGGGILGTNAPTWQRAGRWAGDATI